MRTAAVLDSGHSAVRSPFVGGQGKRYRFTVLSEGLLRYEWAPDGQFEDRPSSFATNRPGFSSTDFQVKESVKTLQIITSRFHLTYDKHEFTSHGLFALVFEHTRSLWRYGEHKPWENLGGTARTLDEADGRIDMGTGIMSEKGYATIDDSTSMLFEKNGNVASRRPGQARVDGYLFAYGHDFRSAIQAFYYISGLPPLLPRWSLGNWWSRYYAYTADSYLALVDKFQEIGVPLSVGVLDMDWHLVDDPRVIEAKQTGWTGYTWNRNLFPDPPAFIRELHKRNLMTALNDHPSEGIHSYEDMYYKVAEAMGLDVSEKQPITFDVTDTRFLDAYLEVLLASLEADGCDFWWIDWQQGRYSLMEGVDPLWMLNHYHFLHIAKSYPNRHPIIFSRYAGPGSHRYPIGFSGDSIVSWKSLQFQPEFTATASNIGYGWWSHDIGGHMEGAKDEELTVRWVQLGVFSPIMRLHSVHSRWVAKEPWKFEYSTGIVISDFLRLRHRLIPYLHTMNARAAIQGQPLIQPMYWEHSFRQEAYRLKNQYLFGSELMVMPITSPQDPKLRLAKVKGWLPPGKHVDFFTGVVYDGNRDLWFSRPLGQYPVFMKQGTIVPLDLAERPGNGAANPDGFEVVIAVGADASFEILEENEEEDASPSKSAQDIEWIRTQIRFSQATGTVRIDAGAGKRRGGQSITSAPSSRNWSLRLLGLSSQVARIESGVKITADAGASNSGADQSNPKVSAASNGCVVDLGRLPTGATTTIELGLTDPHIDSADNWTAPIERIIDNAAIEYGLKDAIWEIIEVKEGQEAIPKSIILNRLMALDKMSEDLLIAISEYII